jgi:Do/DeqQ family serine protease
MVFFKGKRRILMMTKNIHSRSSGAFPAWFIIGVTFAVALLSLPAMAAEAKEPVNLITAIRQVAKETIPAVAHIEVTQHQEIANPFFPSNNDPFFRFFFDVPGMPRKFNRELKGLGTGMIMNSKGYILTNNHVVGGATEISVLLANGNTYDARLVGADPKTDLAVIKIAAKEDLPHVTFGDSDKMEVGDWVIAIGDPRGLDQTVTQGIISAKHRRGITDPSSYQDFLQTDAAINPGNSGGPLLNLKGEVIGVNAAIVTQSGGFEGLSFAIPSNMALHVAQSLIENGKVARGWLGVSTQDLTPELARSFGIKGPHGALVADVVKGSPAEKAGLRRGDVIIAYGGHPITDGSTLRNTVANSNIGRKVDVTIIRNREEHTIPVLIGSLDHAIRMQASSLKARLGIDAAPIRTEEARKFGLHSQHGVRVTWVDPDGPLGEVGFEVGDLILEVDGHSMEGLEDLAKIVQSLRPHQRLTLLALDHRTGRTGYVQIRSR